MMWTTYHRHEVVWRFTRGTTLMPLCAALLLLHIGCAGFSKYCEGIRLMETGNYDEAVVALEAALSEAPENNQYQEKLATARSQAAERRLQRAVSCLSESRPSAARQELMIAAKYDPDHPELKGYLAKVDELIAAAEAKAAVASRKLEEKAWDEAVACAREAFSLDKANESISQLLQRCIAASLVYHLEEAQRALEAQNWDQCLAECKRARELAPDNATAMNLEKTVEVRRECLALSMAAEELVNKNQIREALDLLNKAYQLWPENERVGLRLGEVRGMVIAALCSDADQKAVIGDFENACEFLQEALRLDPGNTAINQKLSQMVNRWATALLTDAKSFINEKKWELVWRNAIAAETLTTDVTEVSRPTATLAEQEIRRGLAYRLSIIPIAPSREGAEADIATRAAGILENVIRQVKPAHVEIVDRTHLSWILQEADLFRMNSGDSAVRGNAGGQLLTADAILLVKSNVDEGIESNVKAYGTCQYKAGIKYVRNPAYDEAVAQLEAAHIKQRNVANAKMAANLWGFLMGAATEDAAFGSFAKEVYSLPAQAEQNSAAAQMHAAQVRLNTTPQMIPVDDIREYKYPIYRVLQRMRIQIELKLVDCRTTQVLWVGDHCIGEAIHEGEQVEPRPEYGLAGLAFQSQDSSVMRRAALENVRLCLEQMGREVLMKRTQAYLERAKRMTGEQQVIDCVRFLMDSSIRPRLEDITFAIQGAFSSLFSGERLRACQEIIFKRLGMEQLPVSTPARMDGVALTNELKPNWTTGGDAGKTGHGHIVTGITQATTQPAAVNNNQSTGVHRVCLSRDDPHHSKEKMTIDNLLLKLKDVDDNPLRADIEIRIGKRKERIKYASVGTTWIVQGESGRRYQLYIEQVDKKTETVQLMLSAVE